MKDLDGTIHGPSCVFLFSPKFFFSLFPSSAGGVEKGGGVKGKRHFLPFSPKRVLLPPSLGKEKHLSFPPSGQPSNIHNTSHLFSFPFFSYGGASNKERNSAFRFSFFFSPL